jgi:hypothetical protein
MLVFSRAQIRTQLNATVIRARDRSSKLRLDAMTCCGMVALEEGCSQIRPEQEALMKAGWRWQDNSIGGRKQIRGS